MNLTYEPLTVNDTETLIEWLTSETWHYHVNPSPSREQVRAWLDEGLFSGEDIRTFWVLRDGKERAGLIRLHDLQDATPTFDIRIQSPYQGNGIGTQSVKWLTAYLLASLPHIMRVEGQTREDNRAMRRVFRRCGYTKEAHYRQAWPTEDGRHLDSVGYGILRDDWAIGQITPVNWEDE